MSKEMLPTQDDGYLSEGGASFYARKIQSRIALEKQKEVEEQRNRLLLGGGGQQGRGGAGGGGGGLPEVLGGAGGLQRGEAIDTDSEIFFSGDILLQTKKN